MPNTAGSTTVQLTARGPFDLSASIRFLEGFTPAGQSAADGSGLLRLAFPAEDGWEPVGVAARQHGRTVTLELSGQVDDPAAVADQAARILSLDVDGSGFLALGRRDPVVGHLQARYSGLRPVQFHSPYEAACWAIIGQRIRITQAAAIKSRIADECGHPVTVAGQRLAAFPGPEQSQHCALPGLPAVKVERLRGVASAALEGRLASAQLRSVEPDIALAQLAEIPGIGPFSAELILARGAGHPDVFPTAERRLHEEMTLAYGLSDPSIDQLAAIADGWRPYRTWVGLLLRTRREDDTHEIAGGVGASRSDARLRP